MSANKEFKDIMHEINTIAKGKNFTNGRDWAEMAERCGELTHLQYMEYYGCHTLRNQSAHGNDRDVEISQKTLNQAKFFLNKINRTKLVGKNKQNSNQSKNSRYNSSPNSNFNSRKPIRPANISFYGFEVERCILIMRRRGIDKVLGSEISLERAVVRGLLMESKFDLDLRAIKYGIEGASLFESKETLRNRIARHMVENVPRYEIAYLMTL